MSKKGIAVGNLDALADFGGRSDNQILAGYTKTSQDNASSSGSDMQFQSHLCLAKQGFESEEPGYAEAEVEA